MEEPCSNQLFRELNKQSNDSQRIEYLAQQLRVEIRYFRAVERMSDNCIADSLLSYPLFAGQSSDVIAKAILRAWQLV
jgi:hypothetical protein